MVLKTKTEARANFEAAIPYIPDRYESGVKKADWFTPAASDQAEKNFADQMSKVIADKTRQKAIKALGSNKPYVDGAITKGKPIIGDRIRKALDKWLGVWGPMYDDIVALVPTLPPKTPDFMANITNRLVKVVEQWKKSAGKL